MSQRWILTALGQDRPGIVAGVTKSLFELGCNLEDSAMTRLEGEFAIQVIFSTPRRTLSQAKLEEAFQTLARSMKLVVYLKPLTRAETAVARRGRPYHISVYGADRPGIVYRVAELLARLRVNITDVSTHRSIGRRAAGGPLYLMLLEVELPARLTSGVLERPLQALAKRLGVHVSVRSADTEVL